VQECRVERRHQRHKGKADPEQAEVLDRCADDRQRDESDVMVTAWSPMTLVVAELTWPERATLQVAKISGSAATGAVMNRPPTTNGMPSAPMIFSDEKTVK
jgi:hypothetical protein